ncbi:uncharacterized protein CYBJADRAFT_172042 [Cyberlindnera jadinii NRRL Y-1542]|uniref:Proteasome assembly chaperone 3 n=1 Tax=Cyberlindnera jadinii (strain ATCC 18201 / CBS 1600 / BCRC 20928 / JCM 3617 / NBRC 0987 / NRRL Y-1542) TaxID=983966 RepID=A0A1E4S697_CYBJN|nr:hypothetical protein CYBJADRAFT_172042 [Cyberlindnera jadinii NRRL Y-1542]ODV75036.1 hypothetical protein CYBJADRAFT_172042 [Cyberlindnera jadinii NRRL Y-1542]
MTTTSSHIISPPFAEDVQLLLNVPKHKPILGHRNKVAISVFIAPPGTANVPIGCYIYGLYDIRRSQVYQTTLNNSQEPLFDMTKRISHVITKKYQCPTYVCCTGGIDPLAVLGIIKELITIINEQWTDEDNAGQP